MKNIINEEQWLSTELGLDILRNKYFKNGETFTQWLDRVSGKNEDVRQLILEKKFLFGGRTLSNRRANNNSSLSNCYSSGYVQDSLSDIMDTCKNIATTYKSQGGQGLSLSMVRPKGSLIAKSGYTSDGIVPFMKLFNQVTDSISQGGSRKGALMMSLDITHKEAEEFIKIKRDLTSINKANLSLEIDDEFMETVRLLLMDEENGNKDAENIEMIKEKIYDSGKITYAIKPLKIFKLLCETSWNCGEPGVIFTNKFRNYNLMQYCDDYNIITSNPCGEQPLPNGGACNLGSMNLSEYVLNPYTENAEFDLSSFVRDVPVAIRALDEVVDDGINLHALRLQKKMSKNYRNIGLGVMGLGSMFFKLGMRYDSFNALNLVDIIFRNMLELSVKTSVALAKEKGPFPKYDEKIWNADILKDVISEKDIEKFKEIGIRNCSLLSIAPSGSIGTMLGITTGIEPAFRLSYNRKTESLHNQDVYYTEYIKEFEEYKAINNTDVVPDFFVCSDGIDYSDRIKVQSVAQRYVDTGISSTVNLPASATIKDVEKLYMMAWENGLKGITIFRDNCARSGILTTDTKDEQCKETSALNRGEWKKLATDIIYYPRKIKIGCGKIKLFIGWSESEKEIQDLYVQRSGQGGCSSLLQTTAITMSGMLRLGGSLSNIHKAFEGLDTCNSFTAARAKGRILSKGNSCGIAILNEIMDFMKTKECCDVSDTDNHQQYQLSDEVICPVCGNTLEFVGGCKSCSSCGYSKCE